MACDPNAQISVISGAWAIVRYFIRTRTLVDIRREAARVAKDRGPIIWTIFLRSHYAKARIRIWTLAEFVENPMEPLQSIVDEISPRSRRRLTEAPILADLRRFWPLLAEPCAIRACSRC